MIERTRLIQDLRNKFKDGATPSRLIEDIISELGDSISSREVQEILMDAFLLPVVRLGSSLHSGKKGYQIGILNKAILAEIVENREKWDSLSPSSGEVAWLDGLHVVSPEETKKKAASIPFPGMTRESWEALSHTEQETLLVTLASGQVLSSRVEILSRLAERLQEKIDDLEDKLRKSHT